MEITRFELSHCQVDSTNDTTQRNEHLLTEEIIRLQRRRPFSGHVSRPKNGDILLRTENIDRQESRCLRHHSRLKIAEFIEYLNLQGITVDIYIQLCTK